MKILDAIWDGTLDTLKLIPFLFITYLVMEWVEHRTSDHTKTAIRKAGRLGPLVGGILGVIPQCGFSAAAASLYAGKVITAGTLIAVFLSTSDEMLPILLSERAGIGFIAKNRGWYSRNLYTGALSLREGNRPVSAQAYCKHYILYPADFHCAEYSSFDRRDRESVKPGSEPACNRRSTRRPDWADTELCGINSAHAAVSGGGHECRSDGFRADGRSRRRTACAVPHKPAYQAEYPADNPSLYTGCCRRADCTGAPDILSVDV